MATFVFVFTEFIVSRCFIRLIAVKVIASEGRKSTGDTDCPGGLCCYVVGYLHIPHANLT